MKLTRRIPQAVLGVRMDTDELRAVLMERTSDGGRVVQVFREKRIPDYERTEYADASEVLVEEAVPAGEDSFVTGDGFGDSLMEDTVVSMNIPMEPEAATEQEDSRKGYPIVELERILNQCAALGYTRPVVVICMSHPDIVYEEVTLLKEVAEAKSRRKKGDPVREQILRHFQDNHIPIADGERLGYVPMDETATTRRYLAVAPAVDEPVEPTIRTWYQQRKFTQIRLWKAEDEVSFYAGVARHVLEPEEGTSTLIVRAGSRDTLIIGLEGRTLKLEEHLYSLTKFDAVDTVCRRIMLLLDEYGISSPDHVLVIDEDPDSHLKQGFQVFFPEAEVSLLGDYFLELFGEELTDETYRHWTGPVVALAYKEFFPNREEIGYASLNLLPPAVRRSPIKVKLAWHTYLLAVLLFGSTFFFVLRFNQQRAAIAEWEQRVIPYQTADFSQDIRLLQQRIDSLQSRYVQYEHTLNVLDSLLTGSDRWSRMIAHLTEATGKLGNVWVEKWTLTSDGLILQGRAMNREAVVAFARDFSGTIQSLWYDEIRDERIYSFTMQVALAKELPEAARYLRKINRQKTKVG